MRSGLGAIRGLTQGVLVAALLVPAAAFAIPTLELVVRDGKIISQQREPGEVCIGPGSFIDVRFTFENGDDMPASASFDTTLSAGLTAVPGTCSAPVGTCTIVTPSNVTWSGAIGAGRTETIFFRTRVGLDVLEDTQLCLSGNLTFGAEMAMFQECLATTSSAQCLVGAPQLGPGALAVLALALGGTGALALRRRSRSFRRGLG